MESRHARLKHARQRAGLTQKASAKALNRSVQTVKGWESGRSEPGSLDEVVRVCNLYNISVDYYVNGPAMDKSYAEALLAAADKLSDKHRQALLKYLHDLSS